MCVVTFLLNRWWLSDFVQESKEFVDFLFFPFFHSIFPSWTSIHLGTIGRFNFNRRPREVCARTMSPCSLTYNNRTSWRLSIYIHVLEIVLEILGDEWAVSVPFFLVFFGFEDPINHWTKRTVSARSNTWETVPKFESFWGKKLHSKKSGKNLRRAYSIWPKSGPFRGLF